MSNWKVTKSRFEYKQAVGINRDGELFKCPTSSLNIHIHEEPDGDESFLVIRFTEKKGNGIYAGNQNREFFKFILPILQEYVDGPEGAETK